MRRLLCVLAVACSNAPPPEPVASTPQPQPSVPKPQPVVDDFYAACAESPPPEPCGDRQPEVLRVASRLVTMKSPFAFYMGGKREVWTDEAGEPQGGPVTEVLVELSCPPPNLDKNVTETIVVGETVLGEAGWERGRCVVAHTRATRIPDGGIVRYIFPYTVDVPPTKQEPRFVAPTNPPVSISPNPPKLASNAP